MILKYREYTADIYSNCLKKIGFTENLYYENSKKNIAYLWFYTSKEIESITASTLIGP